MNLKLKYISYAVLFLLLNGCANRNAKVYSEININYDILETEPINIYNDSAFIAYADELFKDSKYEDRFNQLLYNRYYLEFSLMKANIKIEYFKEYSKHYNENLV
jgi:hypothetical protein